MTLNVVIDGMDAVGKQTQKGLVAEQLANNLIRFKSFSFPDYSSYTGNLIREYLRKGSVSNNFHEALVASNLYTANRFEKLLREGILEGKDNSEVLLFDRYTTSNLVFQTLNLNDEETALYIRLLSRIEYRQLKLPEPDVVIFLVVNPQTSIKNVEKRGLETDFFETVEVQQKIYDNIHRISKMTSGCNIIHVDDIDGNMRSKEEINKEIMEIIKKSLYK